ncbi:MAG: LLM class F420-dependent oxidoreductase [Chloroflexota bacterium]
MQVGVVFPQTEFGNDPAALRDWAQAVEGMGFSHILAYDHVLSADASRRPGFSGPYTLDHPFHEIFVLFGFLAAVTERVGLVTGVVILPQRQTALVAKQAAEVDVLSRGRLRLGIGVGWNEVEFDGLGKDFSDRGVRSEEQIRLMRALWAEPSVRFSGRWESVIDAGIVPLPVQRPIPVWFGGYVEATIRRVGQMGDGWFPWRPLDDWMLGALDRMRRYAADAGRDPGRIGLEPQLNVGQGAPADWSRFVRDWQAQGADRFCLTTMGNGFATPAQHLAAVERAGRELGVVR